MTQQSKRKEFRILSIDGGGIRGIVPATMLDYFEQRIKGNLYEYFDLIVGTSTGAIIALALALGIRASQLVDLYQDKGKYIFPQWRWRRLGVGGLIVPKYSSSALQCSLIDLLRVEGREAIIQDAKTRVCVPTINMVTGKPVVFKTRHHEGLHRDYKIAMWKAAMSSASAPVFFPSFDGPDKGRFIDGGLWANNPSLIGISEAVKLGYDLTDIIVLSIGTGSNVLHKRRIATRTFGFIGWRSQLIEAVFAAQSHGMHYTAEYMCGGRYSRLNVDFPNPSFLSQKFKLDGISALDDMQNIAHEKAKEKFTSIQSIFFQKPTEKFVPVPLT